MRALQSVRQHEGLVAQDFGTEAPVVTTLPPSSRITRAHSSTTRSRSWVQINCVTGRAQQQPELAPPARIQVAGQVHPARAGGDDRPGARPGRPDVFVPGSSGGARVPRHLPQPDLGQGLLHPGPRFSPSTDPLCWGPKATSSPTVGQNNWSSGSWNSRPTRARIPSRWEARRPVCQTRGRWAGGPALREEARSDAGAALTCPPRWVDQSHALALGHGEIHSAERVRCRRDNGSADFGRRGRSRLPPRAHMAA